MKSLPAVPHPPFIVRTQKGKKKKKALYVIRTLTVYGVSIVQKPKESIRNYLKSQHGGWRTTKRVEGGGGEKK